ncbi:MAG: phosphatidylserine decarboxylase family protein [Bacteroidaceae bacterium]|nr:phosphatidylserine decarboxylase family protein [Bacteroidaceae bacterium]
MGNRLKKLKKIKKIRLHHEGVNTLIIGAICLVLFNAVLFYAFPGCIPVYIVAGISVVIYLILVNFFQCPIRVFESDTEGVVVAPADGRIVVIEEVEENEYFHDRRLMVSIFMSLFNVHANWIPVEGTIKMVRHHDGNFMRAWLPKASTENERSTIVIATPDGTEILARQIAGAMARRIVTYVQEGDSCFIDEHLGFIKLGSRVDLYLPLGTEVKVKMGQKTVGNETIIAQLGGQTKV